MKGIRGSLPARLSQPVDPGGVGGLFLCLLIVFDISLMCDDMMLMCFDSCCLMLMLFLSFLRFSST